MKVKTLLKSLPYEDQKLIRLDTVLNVSLIPLGLCAFSQKVLEVNSEELLDKLFTYFLVPCDESRPQGATMSSPKSSNFVIHF